MIYGRVYSNSIYNLSVCPSANEQLANKQAISLAHWFVTQLYLIICFILPCLLSEENYSVDCQLRSYLTIVIKMVQFCNKSAVQMRAIVGVCMSSQSAQHLK